MFSAITSVSKIQIIAWFKKHIIQKSAQLKISRPTQSRGYILLITFFISSTISLIIGDILKQSVIYAFAQNDYLTPQKVIILSRLFQFGWSEERKKEFEKDLTEMLEMYSFDLDEYVKQIKEGVVWCPLDYHKNILISVKIWIVMLIS